MKLSLIIPMYNESAIIAETAKTYFQYLSSHFEDFELIFVDDGSTDDCAARVEALRLPCVQVLRYTPNQGKGNAVKTGMLAATGDVRMFLDADVAYGTEVIGRAAAAIAICGGLEGNVTGIFPPCGVCRQVLREFCSLDMPVLLVSSSEPLRYERLTLGALLPYSFGPENL